MRRCRDGRRRSRATCVAADGRAARAARAVPARPEGGLHERPLALAELAGLAAGRVRAARRCPEVSAALTVHDMNVWGPSTGSPHYDGAERERMLGEDGWLRFTIVRDPWRRLWSALAVQAAAARAALRRARSASEPWFPRVPERPGRARRGLPPLRRRRRRAATPRTSTGRCSTTSSRSSRSTTSGASSGWARRSRGCATHVGGGRAGRAAARARTERRCRCRRTPTTSARPRSLRERYARDFEAFGYDAAPPRGRRRRRRGSATSRRCCRSCATAIDAHERVGQLHRARAAAGAARAGGREPLERRGPAGRARARAGAHQRRGPRRLQRPLGLGGRSGSRPASPRRARARRGALAAVGAAAAAARGRARGRCSTTARPTARPRRARVAAEAGAARPARGPRLPVRGRPLRRRAPGTPAAPSTASPTSTTGRSRTCARLRAQVGRRHGAHRRRGRGAARPRVAARGRPRPSCGCRATRSTSPTTGTRSSTSGCATASRGRGRTGPATASSRRSSGSCRCGRPASPTLDAARLVVRRAQAPRRRRVRPLVATDFTPRRGRGASGASGRSSTRSPAAAAAGRRRCPSRRRRAVTSSTTCARPGSRRALEAAERLAAPRRLPARLRAHQPAAAAAGRLLGRRARPPVLDVALARPGAVHRPADAQLRESARYPDGYEALFWLATHVADPIAFGEWLGVALMAVSGWLVFPIVREHTDWRPAAWIAAALFLALIDIHRFHGGFPRAFVHPVVLLTVLLAMRRRRAAPRRSWPRGGALFYPPAALLAVGVLCVSALRWSGGRPRIDRAPRGVRGCWRSASRRRRARPAAARRRRAARVDGGRGARVPRVRRRTATLHFFVPSALEYLRQNRSGFDLRASGQHPRARGAGAAARPAGEPAAAAPARCSRCRSCRWRLRAGAGRAVPALPAAPLHVSARRVLRDRRRRHAAADLGGAVGAPGARLRAFALLAAPVAVAAVAVYRLPARRRRAACAAVTPRAGRGRRRRSLAAAARAAAAARRRRRPRRRRASLSRPDAARRCSSCVPEQRAARHAVPAVARVRLPRHPAEGRRDRRRPERPQCLPATARRPVVISTQLAPSYEADYFLAGPRAHVRDLRAYYGPSPRRHRRAQTPLRRDPPVGPAATPWSASWPRRARAGGAGAAVRALRPRAAPQRRAARRALAARGLPARGGTARTRSSTSPASRTRRSAASAQVQETRGRREPGGRQRSTNPWIRPSRIV